MRVDLFGGVMDGVRKSQYTIAFKHFMLRKYCCFAKMNDIIKRKYLPKKKKNENIILVPIF